MKKDQPFSDAAAYDRWYDDHKNAYQSELLAIKKFVLKGKKGLEVGVGTGRFASELDIQTGVEPAPHMAAMATARGIHVIEGVAEHLPFDEASFDFVLMVTVDCFLNDIEKAYKEALRVLKPGGKIIIGLLDRNGEIARKYQTIKANHKVYRNARFHTPEEIIKTLKQAGFIHFDFCQTLMTAAPDAVEEPLPGYGKGSFVVISAEKFSL